MTQSEHIEYDLLTKVEENFPADHRRPQGSGVYVTWVLKEHGLTPDDLLFADVLPAEADFDNFRTGVLFLVTDTAVIFAEYTHAPGDVPPATPEDYGTLSLAYFPRHPGDVRSLRWADRSLFIPKDDSGGRPRPLLKKDSISVEGDGWKIQLPGYDTTSGDAYFRRLRDALLGVKS